MIINEKRALAYTAKCGSIRPIEGADNIDLMAVNGWNVIVKKGEFQEGDLKSTQNFLNVDGQNL